ncbi:M20 metallopeptidase family protein [Paraliomyxa miuraensis]|uniref:M20 metallopeptidase family protein n=1 Tax=Paraliomyxa miuraensis TaxID=376150 RepID=UPI0022574C24|nr:M20 family metallopeptidase [Paraliomyxa miuraensis]MCX4241156.1 M20 family metallopeptidase [Paraliomyxa miuraensis]
MGQGMTGGGWTDAEIEALLPELREIRHDLHQHPELGFEEHRTQARVRGWLETHGYAPRDCAGTGLVAELHPEGPGHDAGRCIALRADLDCLPIHESTPLPYRSVHEGRAHKCGHDGHTTILMGVAALLARHRDRVPGRVRLLFQPAEEGVDGGGAKVMVAEGALDGVDEVYGLHNWPPFPHGELRVTAGATMAQTRELAITVTGKGGHGSQPQACRDPIVAAAHLVTALQTVVSRGLGSDGGAVVSVCRFAAGHANNVIPDRAELAGTVRSFDPAVDQRVVERIEEIVRGIAATFGVELELSLGQGYPVLMNHEHCASAVQRVGERVVGPSRVSATGLPIAGGEDFAYFTQAVPGAYFFLGAGRAGEDTPGCHHPDFDFDDALIPIGIRMFLGLVEDRLGAAR